MMKNCHSKSFLFVLLLASFVVSSVTAATRYVAPAAVASNPDGAFLSVATAARTIQDAVNVARFGDHIVLLPGTHYPAANVYVDSPLNLVFRSQQGRDETIIDMQQQDRAFYFFGAGSSEIRDLTIRNGLAKKGTSAYAYGGGIYIVDGGRVVDCIVENSWAEYGGGIRIVSAGQVINSIVRSNQASQNGGGIHIANGGEVYDTLVYSNSASVDAGGIYMISGGLASNCEVFGNTANNFGGGVYILNAGELSDSKIWGNTGVFGGGVRLQRDTGSSIPLLARSLVYSNAVNRFSSSTPGLGGGVHVVVGRVENVVVYDNVADGHGGGVALRDTDATLINSTVAYNETLGTGIGGGLFTTAGRVINSVVYFNSSSDSAQRERNTSGSQATYTYSLTFPAPVGTGNLAGRVPIFEDADARDLRLQGSSPGIDTGTNVGSPRDDVTGRTRPLKGLFLSATATTDMGAYEYQLATAQWTISAEYAGYLDTIGAPPYNGIDYAPFDGRLWMRITDGTSDLLQPAIRYFGSLTGNTIELPQNVPMMVSIGQDWRADETIQTWEPVLTVGPITLTADTNTTFYLQDSEIDSDGDGLTDFAEHFLWGMNSNVADSEAITGTVGYDGILVTNGAVRIRAEYVFGGPTTNVLDEVTIAAPGAYSLSGLPVTADYRVIAYQDLNGDGVHTRWEPIGATNRNSGLPLDITMTDPDADGDGLTDYQELFVYGTNPDNPDTSGDGIPDGWLAYFSLNPLQNWATNVVGTADMTVFAKYDYSKKRLAADDYALPGLPFDPADGLDPRELDTDGDGIPDGWEVYFDPNPLAHGDDSLATDPLDPNDAGMRLAEHLALVALGQVPTNAPAHDIDLDGVSNRTEYEYSLQQLGAGFAFGVGLNPLEPDSDNDGMPDGWELFFALDPLDATDAGIGLTEHRQLIAAQVPINHTPEQDPDFDGLSNLTEYQFSSLDYFNNEPFAATNGLSPRNPDTDGDQMIDGWELIYWSGIDGAPSTDPLVADADADPDNDGLTNLEEYFDYDTKPINPDTSGDGIPDGWAAYFGLNPLSSWTTNVVGAADMTVLAKYNASEQLLVASTNRTSGLDFDPVDGLNPLVLDTDGDGMPDGWEVYFGLNALVDDGGDTLNVNGDMTNLEKYTYSEIRFGVGFAPEDGLDPGEVDTDRDGAPDGLEIQLGSDPLDIDSFPVTISGTLTYNGTQPGTFVLMAMDAGTPGLVYKMTTTNTGPFQMDYLVPNNQTYAFGAFLDYNGNLEPETWEAFGRYADTNDVYILVPATNAVVSGIDIELRDVDTDGDGLTDFEELYVYDSDPDLADTSGDGVSDGWLVYFGLPPRTNYTGTLLGGSDMTVVDKYQYSTNRFGVDFDFSTGLNPTNASTDGDWAFDGLEITWGSDPLDPASYPITLSGGAENATAVPVLSGPLMIDVLTPSGTNDVVVGTFAFGDIAGGETLSGLVAAYVPNNTSYWVRAYIDLQTNGVWNSWDPYGLFGDRANTITPVNDDVFGTISIQNSVLDSDGDGLTDYDEVFVHGTDPFDTDSDGDGFSDSEELALGTDPNEVTSFPANLSGNMNYPEAFTVAGTLRLVVTNATGDPWYYDFDLGVYADGPYTTITNVPTLSDYFLTAYIDENGNGIRDSWEPFGVPFGGAVTVNDDVVNLNITLLNPTVDTDGDGLTDFDETYIWFTDPALTDTDGDTFDDGFEVAIGSDPTDIASYPINMSGTVSYTGPQTGTVYVVADYGSGIISNALPIGSGTLNFSTAYAVTNIISARSYTVSAYRDTNGDGTRNGFEASGVFTNFAILNPSNALTGIDIILTDPGADIDTDRDGVSDFDEVYIWGSDPENPDSSGDGIADGWLTHFGLSPTNLTWSTNILGTADMTVLAKYTNSVAALAPGMDLLQDGLTFDPALGLDPTVLSTDADGFGDGFELTWRSDPLDALSFPVEIAATVLNNATNTFAVLNPLTAPMYMVFNLESNGNFFAQMQIATVTNATGGLVVTTPAAYVPTLSNYWVSVYIDLDGDGERQPWDPVGFALNGTNSIQPVANMTIPGVIGIEDSSADTDGDGLTDFEEQYVWFTDPELVDTDGDTFSDFDEVMTYFTNPNDPDSFPATIGGDITYAEASPVVGNLVIVITNNNSGSWTFDLGPYVPGAAYQTPTNLPTLFNYFVTAFIDEDGSGLLEVWKPQGVPATNPTFLTTNLFDLDIEIVHPGLDSDNDGLSDFDEVYVWFSDPLDPDSSNDGIPDGWLAHFGLSPTNLNWSVTTEGTADMTVLAKYQYSEARFAPGWVVTNGIGFDPAIGLDPRVLDTDTDGISDDIEINTLGSDPLLADTSGDGIPDGWLHYFGLDPLIDWRGDTIDPADMTVLAKYTYSEGRFVDDATPPAGLQFDPGVGLNPTIFDTDGDGLGDGEEINTYGTDPLNTDSDLDGFTDYEEVIDIGSDPLNGLDPIVVDDDHPDDPLPGDPNFSNPEEDGSRNAPLDSIQKAINRAVNGRTVLVMDGLYQSTGNFNIRPNGRAIRIRSMNGFEFTTIRTDNGSGFLVNGGEGTNTVIEGFTIQTSVADLGGAGILVDGASPILQNNRFFDCGQAGVLVRNGGNPIIRDSLFEENQGGIKVVNSSPRIERCTIRFNRDVLGGGIYVEGSASVTSQPVIVNCVIVQNAATDIGGGLYSGANTAPFVLHTTIADNVATNRGGGLYNAGDLAMWNSILWGNAAPVGPGFSIDRFFDMSYSISQTPRAASFEVITNSPSFVGGLDYSLRSDSPAIDFGSGNLTAALTAITPIPGNDIVGATRPEFIGGGRFPGYDVGAYEYIPGGSISIQVPGSVADEVLLGGLPYTIEWTYDNDSTVGSNLVLEYTYNFKTDPSGIWTVSTTNVFRGNGGSGSFDWVVPTNIVDRLYIRLTDATNSQITAVSDLEARVRSGLRVLAPTGSPVYYPGDTVTVQWASSPATNDVVTLSLEGESTITTNVAHVAGNITNSFDWVLPLLEEGILTDAGVVRVSSAGILSDVTDDPFSVHGIVVYNPQVGGTVETGGTYNVRWKSLGAGTNVSLSYSEDAGGLYVPVETNYPNVDGTNSYSWTVTQGVTSQAVWRVASLTNLNAVGVSGVFRVSDISGSASIQGDGIPDSWRVANGLDPENLDGVSGALDDADGDGMTNYEEWLAGTSPTSTESYLGIVALQMVPLAEGGIGITESGQPTGFSMSWQTVPGKRYAVSSVDTADGVWELASEIMTATGDQLTWVDTREDMGRRFYRIVLILD